MISNLKGKFDEALNIFVNKYKKNTNVVAILVSGSYVHSKPDKNSDLDVYVILEKAKTRERGSTWINGVEIEYFMNPINQIRYYFKKETGNKAPCTAHMFANSIIVYQKGNTINQLIKEANVFIKKKMTKMNKMETELVRSEIDDVKKDVEDVYLKKDFFAFYILANKLLDDCLKLFYKIQRIPKEKTKRLQKQLEQLDKHFEEIYLIAVTEQNIDKKYQAVNKVVDYIEKLIGGKKPKEWKLRSKCVVC